MAEVGGRKKITRTFSKTSFPWFERKSRFMELSIFKQPQCLIFEDESGKLAIKDSVLNEIEVIDVPLSIVAIVGLYRSGKSYLMNQLAGKSKGFSMGHKVHSHTKGIWVWCIIHPKKERHVLMLIDTEGLADPKKQQLKGDWKELRSRNSNHIQEICKEKLDILHDEIIFKEEAYNFEDGYSLFKEHMGYLESNFYSQMKDFDKDELDDAYQRFKDNMNEQKMEIMRKEKIMRDIKQKENMDALLEKRLQEKYESLEREKIAHIENEKRKLIDTMLAQSKANTEALQGALEEVNKRTCILS